MILRKLINLISSTVKIEGMTVNLNAKNFFDGSFDRLNSRVTKLNDFTGIGKDNMVVLTGKITLFVMSLLFSKLMFTNQFCDQQKINRIIKCYTANSVLFIFHHDVKTIYVKMLIGRINFFQDIVSCGSFSVAVG